jgi:ATP-dependent helicase HrpB
MNRPVLPALPVAETLPALRDALRTQGRAVLTAPPGSGKTTLVPLALLEDGWLSGQRMLVLEPRRVAARAAAARMAQLLGERVGETVGYHIRYDRRVSPATRIEVLTEGLLTRRLQADPELPGVGLVIFDEFHERSLDADLALALTLDARAALNPALRVLVMSATLDAARVAALLDAAPVIESGGRLFPVSVHHRSSPEPLPEAMARGVRQALGETEGDVLGFLPGAREIRDTQQLLEGRGLAVFPLYGDLPAEAQDAALRPLSDGRRKVILATNIAQTSLTVEGVAAVVDSGWARVARFDLGSGADRLETERISKASAEQRAGRAGRLGPGWALRLWSAEQQGLLRPHDLPEIAHVDLSRFALELAAWGLRVQDAALMDAPPAAAWEVALQGLRAMAAVDGEGRVTPYGRRLLTVPAVPRRAHLLRQAEQTGLADQAVWLLAALEERSGALDLAETLEAWVGERGDPAVQRRLRDSVRQLAQRLQLRPADRVRERDLARLIAWAYPERIAQRRPGGGGVFLCADGRELRVPEAVPLAQQDWLAVAHWDPGPPRRLRSAVAYAEADLRRDHAAELKTIIRGGWDVQTEAVVGSETLQFGALVLTRKTVQPSAEARVAGVIEGVRRLGIEVLPWDEAARQWQARVNSLRLWQPEAGWPDLSDAALLDGLEHWLAPWLDGVSRRSQFDRIPLLEALRSRLDPAARQAVERLAPTHLTVPSGQRHALQYAAGQPPVLEVKLQEMFGATRTPTVCDGRVAVQLQLLSPARRPVAVTQDLEGFWTKGYFDVRKDLRGRYPRHPWPENPLEAIPTARAKPRR